MPQKAQRISSDASVRPSSADSLTRFNHDLEALERTVHDIQRRFDAYRREKQEKQDAEAVQKRRKKLAAS